MHCLISLNCSASCAQRPEAKTWIHSPFDKSVILLNQVVEVFDGPQLTTMGECTLLLELPDGFGVGRVAIHLDDTRGYGMLGCTGYLPHP